jgi:hypothetical protein
MNSREKLRKVKIIINKNKHGGACKYLLGSAALVASAPVSALSLALILPLPLPASWPELPDINLAVGI